MGYDSAARGPWGAGLGTAWRAGSELQNPVRLEEDMLASTPQQIIDRIGGYENASATWRDAVLRGPIALEGLQLFLEEGV